MRPPKPIACIALAVLLFQTTGCYSFRPLQRELPDTRQGTQQVHQTVRVTKTDGEKVELNRAWKDSVVVGGMEAQMGRQVIREIPLAEVSTLDGQYFRPGRTVLLLLSLGTVAFGVYVYVAFSGYLG